MGPALAKLLFPWLAASCPSCGSAGGLEVLGWTTGAGWGVLAAWADKNRRNWLSMAASRPAEQPSTPGFLWRIYWKPCASSVSKRHQDTSLAFISIETWIAQLCQEDFKPWLSEMTPTKAWMVWLCHQVCKPWLLEMTLLLRLCACVCVCVLCSQDLKKTAYVVEGDGLLPLLGRLQRELGAWPRGEWHISLWAAKTAEVFIKHIASKGRCVATVAVSVSDRGLNDGYNIRLLRARSCESLMRVVAPSGKRLVSCAVEPIENLYQK